MRRGDLAADFALPDQQGRTRTLVEFLAAGRVVLFFYPAALTPGCTAESCRFRDLGAEFSALGAVRVGVSHDEVATQRRFSERHDFDFPLLSDVAGAVARAYGVRRRPSALGTRRWTFVIDRDRRIAEVIKSETRMSAHADRALAALRELASS
ncbi:MAG TPA: peroxiredoxin [Acidimicrobiales bacterium]|nr:peroxiredoxin [Acidimicrobiales bacterium]